MKAMTDSHVLDQFILFVAIIIQKSRINHSIISNQLNFETPNNCYEQFFTAFTVNNSDNFARRMLRYEQKLLFIFLEKCFKCVF